MNETVVAEYGTRLTRTRVVRNGSEGYIWLVRNGVDHPHGPGPGHLVGSGNLEFVPDQGPTRISTAHKGSAWLRYRAYGHMAPLYLLFSDSSGMKHTLSEAIGGMGGALAAIHRSSAPLPVLDMPPGLKRLHAWIASDGQGTGSAGRLFEMASRIIGETGLTRMREWVRELCDSDHRVLVHGSAGLGNLVIATQTNRPHVVLSGDELSRAAGETDVGWMLGELAEIRWLQHRGKLNPTPLLPEEIAGTLVERYDAQLDPVLVGRVATLRILTHVHDFSAYHSWDDSLEEYLEFVADLVANDGSEVRMGM